jgi:hypothetical protein
MRSNKTTTFTKRHATNVMPGYTQSDLQKSETRDQPVDKMRHPRTASSKELSSHKTLKSKGFPRETCTEYASCNQGGNSNHDKRFRTKSVNDYGRSQSSDLPKESPEKINQDHKKYSRQSSSPELAKAAGDLRKPEDTAYASERQSAPTANYQREKRNYHTMAPTRQAGQRGFYERKTPSSNKDANFQTKEIHQAETKEEKQKTLNLHSSTAKIHQASKKTFVGTHDSEFAAKQRVPRKTTRDKMNPKGNEYVDAATNLTHKSMPGKPANKQNPGHKQRTKITRPRTWSATDKPRMISDENTVRHPSSPTKAKADDRQVTKQVFTDCGKAGLSAAKQPSVKATCKTVNGTDGL